MKKWIVRFASLLVFNIVVLLVIGFLTPARVGWSALWAGIVLTALAIWIKPAVHGWFRSMAARSVNQRTRAGEKVVEFLDSVTLQKLVEDQVAAGVQLHAEAAKPVKKPLPGPVKPLLPNAPNSVFQLGRMVSAG